MGNKFNESEPVLKGQWGDEISWEFVISSKMPSRELCTAIICIALVDNGDKVVLAKNERGWELLGGHIEEGESIEEALHREAEEEGGFIIDSFELFGHRKIQSTKMIKHDQIEGQYYPYPVSYVPHFIAHASAELTSALGSDIFESRTFNVGEAPLLGSSAAKEVLDLAVGHHLANNESTN
jgi:8-oxo-dGTP pyrophosphatase MutT (NUDIX family)